MSIAIEKGIAPQTLLAVVTDESATIPNNNISNSIKNVKKSLDVDSEGTKLSVEQIKRYKNVAPELRDEQCLKAKFYLHEAEIIEAGLPFKTAPQLSVDTVSKSASNSSISNSDENVKKSLDVDTDGNKLSAEQQEYFADSKIRDEDGRLLVVYHGTDYDFNVCKSQFNEFFFTDSLTPVALFQTKLKQLIIVSHTMRKQI